MAKDIRLFHLTAALSDAHDESGQDLAGRAPGSLVRIIHSLALIWFGFILVLLALDLVFVTYRPGGRIWPASYYVSNAAAPLLILGLSRNRRVAAHRSGRSLMLFFLGWIIVAPLVITTLALSQPAPGPFTATSGTLTIRTAFIYFLGLAMVAWQYRWREVVLFNLVTLTLTLLGLAVTGNGASPSVPLCVGQTITYLAVGYCMCIFMGRLRAQSQALAQANAQLRRHASTLESLTISRERNRLARELHDTLAHRLSSLAVQLETTKAYLRIDLEIVEDLVENSLASARSGLNETRRALLALRASPLDDIGLALALRELVTSAAAAARLELDLHIDALPELDPEVEQCIYRVTQEAVANSAQHASATRLEVRLRCADDRLRLIVRDDGIGFQLDQRVITGHFGLAGIVERAEMAGGNLTITSAPGAGATVSLELSL
jgi:signal transduction histidine kinase